MKYLLLIIDGSYQLKEYHSYASKNTFILMKESHSYFVNFIREYSLANFRYRLYVHASMMAVYCQNASAEKNKYIWLDL